MTKLSVLIPTHNPRLDYLKRVLFALSLQTYKDFEVIVIDNSSDCPVEIDATLYSFKTRVVSEPKKGLIYARLKGFNESLGEFLVWVDDDNVLDAFYLDFVVKRFEQNPSLGAVGGKSIPEIDGDIPEWFEPGLAPIGCRDHGDNFILMNWDDRTLFYPSSAPIGAGLGIRKNAMRIWVLAVEAEPFRQSLGRVGSSLSSGEDNDINLTLLKAGWSLAYCPNMTLRHIIPSKRLAIKYQRNLAKASFRDFIRVLHFHGITPWKPLPSWVKWILIMKYLVIYKPWRSGANSVRFYGALGQLDGRIDIAMMQESRRAE